MNEEDHQRADDLERVLDEGDIARAAKMVKRWSDAHAQVALAEVQRRNDAYRKDAAASAAGGSPIDTQRFERRDEELASVRRMLG